MKKIKLFIIIPMIILIFSACEGVTMLSDSDADIYAKIHNRYSKMTSYTAAVTITVKGNKTEKKYEANQYYASPDKMAAEFTDTGTKAVITDGDVHISYSGHSAQFPAANDINYLFINEFFKMYYRSQDTALSVSSYEGGGSTILSTELISPTSYRYKAVLTINNKTLNPERLAVRDMADNDVLYADFSSFVYNGKADEGIFTY